MTQLFIFHDGKLIIGCFFFFLESNLELKGKAPYRIMCQMKLDGKKNYVLEEEAIQRFCFSGINVHLE